MGRAQGGRPALAHIGEIRFSRLDPVDPPGNHDPGDPHPGAFEAGRTDHTEELDTTANKLGRLAGRAFAELKKRAKER
jgi:hypothetical protein